VAKAKIKETPAVKRKPAGNYRSAWPKKQTCGNLRADTNDAWFD